MSVSFAIPMWLIWGYAIAGVASATYSWVVEFWRQTINPREVMSHRRFWVRLPIVTALIVALWPYAMWTFLKDKRTTRRAITRHRKATQ